MRRFSRPLVAILLIPGCAGQILRPSAVNDCTNRNGDSSVTGHSSADSSKTSNDSSAASNNSFASSNNSIQNSSNSTVKDVGVQRASAVVAGTALLLTTGVGIGLAIYFFKRSRRDTAPPREVEAKEAQAWLNANLLQLKQDLALGAGPTVMDLASAAQIRTEHLSRFGRMLQEHRAELLQPTRSGRVSLDEAAQVMERIGELTQADEVLKQDAAGWLERHQGPG